MSGFKPRTWVVELYQGDWQQRIEDAAQAVDKARADGPPQMMGEESPVDVAVREYNALLDEAVADRVTVTLQALGRRKFAELVAANPPRTSEDVPESVRKNDADIGVNDEAFGEALVPPSILVIDPEMSKDELLDNISSIQFDLLYGRAFMLNKAVGADPKAVPRLTPSQSSSETEN